MTVNSEAAGVVAPAGFAQDYPIKPSLGPRNGAKHRGASRSVLASQGEKKPRRRRLQARLGR